jgi:hypothetical protein
VYPIGSVQVFICASNGSSQYAASFEQRPSYRELDDMLSEARKARLEIFKVVTAWARLKTGMRILWVAAK